MFKISFTGHRNKTVNATKLGELAARHPGAVWVHGGAHGFDAQVERVAKHLGVQTVVIRPDYAQYGKAAPHIRNRAIVEQGEMLVALYDGRATGGTASTVKYARSKGKEVEIWSCD